MTRRRVGITKVNDEKHVRYSDGTYEPPLPQWFIDQEAKRSKDLFSSPGRAPTINTDTTFMANIPTLGEQFKYEPGALEELKRKAALQGISLNGSELYSGNLADEELDPKACVDSRAAVRKRCLERGVPVLDGMVKVSAAEAEATEAAERRKMASENVPKTGQMARDLVIDRMEVVAKKRPDLVDTREKREEMAHQIIDAHSKPG